MSLVGVLTLSAVVIMASVAANDIKPYDPADAPELFTKFKKDYNRTYKDDADQKLHYDAFVKNLEQINKNNKESKSATHDINQFADYTEEEKKLTLGFKTTTKKD